MPDITMCANLACPRRHECWRAMAIPDGQRQSYAVFKYTVSDDGEFFCREFWPFKKDNDQERIDIITDTDGWEFWR